MGSGTGTPQNRTAAWQTLVLWGFLAVMMVVGAYLSLGACGIGLPGGNRLLFDFCPAPAAAAPDLSPLERERTRQRMLEERLDQLRLTLAAAPDCPVPQQPAVNPPPVAEVIVPEEPPAEVVQITEQDWEDRDVTFLEGCWSLISGIEITDVASNELYGVEDWQICFDEAGNGNQTIVFEDGTTCHGELTAQFLDNGNLRLEDQTDIECTGGFRIFRIVNECERLEDGTARCVGRQPDQGTQDIVSLFRR